MLINEKEYNRIVAMNLKRILFESGKTQTDLSNDLNIPKSTISGWMNGKRTPKMDKIDMLCKYFGCSRADIMEPGGRKRSAVTITDDQAALIQLAMVADPDNISLVLAMLRKLEGLA